MHLNQNHTSSGTSLNAILIVEDEALVALAMEDAVRELGAGRVHICSDASSALEAASTGLFDCAILDVMLRDGTSVDVADRLESRGIPLMFSTGSGDAHLPERHRKHPLISKPFADDLLKATVRAILGSGQSLAVPA
jgi:DNA-binding response OmpR family regulator